MYFKSSKQPLCRYCGKPIAKHTENTWVRHPSDRAKFGPSDRAVYAVLTTKAQCQRHTNHRVVSVRYSRPTEYNIERGDNFEPFVYSFTTWDGETYVDEFFCNGDHAKRFGYAAANSGQVMPAYRAAKGAKLSHAA